MEPIKVKNLFSGPKKNLAVSLKWSRKRKVKVFRFYLGDGSLKEPLRGFNRYRRLSKDYERKPTSSSSHVYVASIRLMLRRIFKERTQETTQELPLLPVATTAMA